MYKLVSKVFVFSALLWLGNAMAEVQESALADLHRGTMVIPCIYVQLPDNSDAIPVDLRMNQRGSALNWEVVAILAAENCTPMNEPIFVEEHLGGKPEKDDKCIAANRHANNCGGRNKKDDDE